MYIYGCLYNWKQWIKNHRAEQLCQFYSLSILSCSNMVSEATPTSSSSLQYSGTPISSSPSMLNHAHHFISTKLSATNYLFWQTQLLPFLHSQNLQGYIDRTHPCPLPLISVNGVTTSDPITTRSDDLEPLNFIPLRRNIAPRHRTEHLERGLGCSCGCFIASTQHMHS